MRRVLIVMTGVLVLVLAGLAMSVKTLMPPKENLTALQAELPIRLANLPSHTVHAIVAAEDPEFFDRWAARSRITSHLARFIFEILFAKKRLGHLSSEERAKETLLILWLSWHLDHHDLIELYLNTVYFGRGAFGVVDAGDAYFGKAAEALAVKEVIFLAMLVKAPMTLDAADPERQRERFDFVVQRMHEAAFLTKVQMHDLLDGPLPQAVSR